MHATTRSHQRRYRNITKTVERFRYFKFFHNPNKEGIRRIEKTERWIFVEIRQEPIVNEEHQKYRKSINHIFVKSDPRNFRVIKETQASLSETLYWKYWIGIKTQEKVARIWVKRKQSLPDKTLTQRIRISDRKLENICQKGWKRFLKLKITAQWGS